MKKRTKIIAGVFSALVFTVLAVALVFPQVAATRYGYFDVNNGRSKLEWVSFGRTYRRSIENTEYSNLLKNLGFEETPPQWELATEEELGLRRLFHAQFVDYYEGSIEADSKVFALTIAFERPERSKARELTEHFRALIRKGNSSEVREYVNRLGQEK